MSRELRNESARTPFLITASQKVGISVGKYQEFVTPKLPHQPRSTLLDCGSRLTRPIPFPGADLRRCGTIPGRLRFAVSLSHRDLRPGTPRFKKSTIGSAAACSERRRRNKYRTTARNSGQLGSYYTRNLHFGLEDENRGILRDVGGRVANDRRTRKKPPVSVTQRPVALVITTAKPGFLAR